MEMEDFGGCWTERWMLIGGWHDDEEDGDDDGEDMTITTTMMESG